jgi:hypothetical protein
MTLLAHRAPALRFVLLGLAPLLLPFAAGCGERACFEWSTVEGACPAQSAALAFFSDPSCPSDIVSVDSEGSTDYGGKLCCYTVTKDESRNFNDCGAGGTTDTGGPGEVAVSTAGVGGGPVMGTCSRCAAAISSTVAEPVCPESQSLLDQLSACTCNGPCFQACNDNICTNSMSSMACVTCLQDSASGCGNQLSACLDDT